MAIEEHKALGSVLQHAAVSDPVVLLHGSPAHSLPPLLESYTCPPQKPSVVAIVEHAAPVAVTGAEVAALVLQHKALDASLLHAAASQFELDLVVSNSLPVPQKFAFVLILR